MASNKQTTILKTNTFEELRQKANEVSLRLGDNDQLDSLLEDKVYNYTASADQIRFHGADNNSDVLGFEISPQNTIDNTAGYIILHGSPTIPAGFVADATLIQTGGYQATITSVTSSKILVRNSSGTFDASLDINVGSDSISASNVRRIIGESYNTAVARVYVNGTEKFQDMSDDGFHVPTYSGLINLSNLSSGDVDDFIEGETVYQGSSLNAATWSGTILECSLTVLRLKTQTGSFSASTQIKVTNSSDTINGVDHGDLLTVSSDFGSMIEFNTPLSNSDAVKIKAVDLVQAINELQDDIGEVENLTTTSTDLVTAINEHDSELGTITSGAMGTTASTVSGAINEHESQIGNADISSISTTDNTIKTALNQLHTEVGSLSLNTTANDLTAAINEHETDIGTVGNLTTSATNLTLAINELDLKQGAATLTTSANTLSGAVNELDAELGTITAGAMGTTASTVSGAIAEHETQIGNVDITAISSTNDTITGALSQLHTEVGTLSLNTTATNLTAAINEHESDIGNMTLTGVSATNLSAAVRELASEKVDLTSSSTQTISSPLTVSGNVTYSNNSGNDTFTFEAGTTLDLSDVDGSTGVTLLLPGSATGVSTFGTAFLATDSTENVQGFRIDRGGVAGAPAPYPTLQWDETISAEEKRWQARGLDTSGTSSRADSLVTFYNAFHLIENGAQSGITVSWDISNQRFDFDVNDFTVTLGTGPISGSFTVTDLANATFDTTLDNDSVTLGTHTTGAYVRRILGTLNEIEVSSNDVETASVTIGLPNAVDIGDLDVTDTTQSSSSTTGALTVAGGAGIAKNLYVGGDLFVQGTQTVLNTATLTVEDTLVLAGNNLSSEPTSGGFGLEVGPITSPGGVAAGVTGAHSIVYNYGYDNGNGTYGRWEADGSLILSEATLGSPDVKANGTSVGDLTPSRSIDFLNGTGITAAVTYDSGTSDFNVVFTNTDPGSSQAIFKNVASDSGTATANINNDTLTITGGNNLSTSVNGDTLTIQHDNSGATAGSYGSQHQVPSITVDQRGHITSISNSATITLASLGYSGSTSADNYGSWTITADSGTADAITSGEVVDIAGGTAISTSVADAGVTITHSNYGPGATTKGTTTRIPTITINAQGHVTALTDAAISYDNYGSWTLRGDTGNDDAITSGEIVDISGDGGAIQTFCTTEGLSVNHGSYGPGNGTSKGSTTRIPTITINGQGHVTGLTDTAISYDNYGSWTAHDNDNQGYTITSGDTLKFAEGTGMDVDFTADDVLTFTNTDRGSSQAIFKNLSFYKDSTNRKQVTANSNNDTMYFYAGTGLDWEDTGGDTVRIYNTAPDRTVTLTGGGATTISGSYPNFTISSTDTNTDTNNYVNAGTYSNGTLNLTGPGLNFNVTGFNTFGGNTYSNNMDQYVRTSDSVKFDALRVGDTTAAPANTIQCTGDVVAYASSDERLKDNIKPIENALDKVGQLKGYEFDWNDKQDVYEGHDIGVIAQEVEKVLPEIVETRAHDGYMAVKYEKLTALLINAVNELKEQNNDLRSEIEKLKSINS